MNTNQKRSGATSASGQGPTEADINRAAQALCFGDTPSEVQERLVKDGLTPYDAFLAIKAAQILRPEVPDPFSANASRPIEVDPSCPDCGFKDCACTKYR
jgi:hypothetical protein